MKPKQREMKGALHYCSNTSFGRGHQDSISVKKLEDVFGSGLWVVRPCQRGNKLARPRPFRRVHGRCASLLRRRSWLVEIRGKICGALCFFLYTITEFGEIRGYTDPPADFKIGQVHVAIGYRSRSLRSPKYLDDRPSVLVLLSPNSNPWLDPHF